MQPAETHLRIFDIPVCIRSAALEIDQWLRFDFSCFVSDPKVSYLTIEVFASPPPSDIIPAIPETMHSPEFVAYDRYPKRYVDYYGRATVVLDYARESAQMYSTDLHLLYEKLYLLILSRVGEKLDRQGLHRVHGMAVTYRDAACLFLMPTRGGKSTLALSLLENSEVKLLSEDTPLIDRRATIFPFLLKLALSQEQLPADVLPQHIRKFTRDKWGDKTLVHLDYFGDKLETKPHPLKFVFVGKWIHADKSLIFRISRARVFLTLLRDCMFGLGLPQIVEYFLTTDKKDLLRKTGIALSRAFACCVATLRSQPYCILLGRDPKINKDTIIEFIDRNTADGKKKQSTVA